MTSVKPVSKLVQDQLLDIYTGLELKLNEGIRIAINDLYLESRDIPGIEKMTSIPVYKCGSIYQIEFDIPGTNYNGDAYMVVNEAKSSDDWLYKKISTRGYIIDCDNDLMKALIIALNLTDDVILSPQEFHDRKVLYGKFPFEISTITSLFGLTFITTMDLTQIIGMWLYSSGVVMYYSIDQFYLTISNRLALSAYDYKYKELKKLPKNTWSLGLNMNRLNKDDSAIYYGLPQPYYFSQANDTRLGDGHNDQYFKLIISLNDIYRFEHTFGLEVFKYLKSIKNCTIWIVSSDPVGDNFCDDVVDKTIIYLPVSIKNKILYDKYLDHFTSLRGSTTKLDGFMAPINYNHEFIEFKGGYFPILEFNPGRVITTKCVWDIDGNDGFRIVSFETTVVYPDKTNNNLMETVNTNSNSNINGSNYGNQNTNNKNNNDNNNGNTNDGDNINETTNIIENFTIEVDNDTTLHDEVNNRDIDESKDQSQLFDYLSTQPDIVNISHSYAPTLFPLVTNDPTTISTINDLPDLESSTPDSRYRSTTGTNSGNWTSTDEYANRLTVNFAQIGLLDDPSGESNNGDENDDVDDNDGDIKMQDVNRT